MKITEKGLRTAVGLGLWALSGAVILLVFVMAAGEGIPGQVLAGAWSVLLTAGMVLAWRSGTQFGAVLTFGMEILVLISAGALAWLRLEATADSSLDQQLTRIRSSLEYRNTAADLTLARAVQATLTARLASMPADY